jgi:hypothetical protein
MAQNPILPPEKVWLERQQARSQHLPPLKKRAWPAPTSGAWLRLPRSLQSCRLKLSGCLLHRLSTARPQLRQLSSKTKEQGCKAAHPTPASVQPCAQPVAVGSPLGPWLWPPDRPPVARSSVAAPRPMASARAPKRNNQFSHKPHLSPTSDVQFAPALSRSSARVGLVRVVKVTKPGQAQKRLRSGRRQRRSQGPGQQMTTRTTDRRVAHILLATSECDALVNNSNRATHITCTCRCIGGLVLSQSS